ncbi:helix-turn-helix transcriptional regulator [Novipirellula sp. SH528]|uniref:helix-turn-helix transcriptional regulator n=1 Tax=Novipirellula sp. SH528 TaxID=3454466 RepID=UPI003FA0B37E
MTLPPVSSSQIDELRSVDRELLMAMRSGDTFGIGDLTEQLGVTATAIRQRIERLLELGLLEREKIVAGRGRPTFQYRLTVRGHRRAGANPAELAEAMWQEILAIPDATIRKQLLSSVANRLGSQFATQVNRESDGDPSFETRMQKLSEMLTDRHITTEVSHSGDLPVLDICACPYPSLTDTSDERAMCRLEEQMISEALGRPVHLSSCRLDGDHCCQFAATGEPSDSAS